MPQATQTIETALISPPAPSTPVMHDQHDLMARVCGVVSRSFSGEAGTPDDWTQRVAGDLRDLTTSSVGVMSMIAYWNAEQNTWDTVSIGLAGDYSPAGVRAIHAQARTGWPDDDFSRTIGHAGAFPVAGCARRDGFIDDDRWRGCAYAAWRASVGVFDLARAIVPFEDPQGRRVMVLQIDGVHQTWRATAQTISMLSCILCPALEAYQSRFVEPRAAQAKVLEKLSPMQRRIAPMLAEGLTEAQIAEQIHRSAHTVHDHTRSIYRVLGVNSRLGLRDMWMGR